MNRMCSSSQNECCFSFVRESRSESTRAVRPVGDRHDVQGHAGGGFASAVALPPRAATVPSCPLVPEFRWLVQCVAMRLCSFWRREAIIESNLMHWNPQQCPSSAETGCSGVDAPNSEYFDRHVDIVDTCRHR